MRSTYKRRATSGDVRDQPKVADAASELVASLPPGATVELEVIVEVAW
jgi:hypothetical protein